jgi:hypothetical protein
MNCAAEMGSGDLIYVHTKFHKDSLKNLKCKAIPVRGRGSLQGCEMSMIPHFLDNLLTDGG